MSPPPGPKDVPCLPQREQAGGVEAPEYGAAEGKAGATRSEGFALSQVPHRRETNGEGGWGLCQGTRVMNTMLLLLLSYTNHTFLVLNTFICFFIFEFFL